MPFDKRKLVALVLVAIVSSGVTWYVASATLTPHPRQKITLDYDFIASGSKAIFFPAVDRGIYEKYGLSVNLVRGFGSIDTIKKLGARTIDFGFPDAGVLVLGRSEGVKVKELAMIYHVAPYAVFFLKGRGIHEPKDLEGKTWGQVPEAATTTLFSAFAKPAGVEIDKMKAVPTDAALIYSALLSGKVDFILQYIYAYPTLEAQARKGGNDVGFFPYGVDIYSNGLAATESTIANHPDLVKRFVTATMEGVLWSVQHPTETTDIVLKYHPELNRELTMGELQITIEKIITDPIIKRAQNGLQLGWMDPAKMERTAKIVNELFGINPHVKAQDLYTDQYVERPTAG